MTRVDGRLILALCVGSALVVAGVLYAIFAPCSSPSADEGSRTSRPTADRRTTSRGGEGSEASEEDMLTPRIALTRDGITLNGTLLLPIDGVPKSDVRKIVPLADALRLLMNRTEARQWGKLKATVTIDADAGALAAGSMLSTIARGGYRNMEVSVAQMRFTMSYLVPAIETPTEQSLYFSPTAPSGYAVAHQHVSRGPHGDKEPCRDLSSSRRLASERDIRSAAAKLCAPVGVDCFDNAVFALPTDRPFGDVAPFLAASIPLSRSLLVRFVADGADPLADAGVCADAGR